MRWAAAAAAFGVAAALAVAGCGSGDDANRADAACRELAGTAVLSGRRGGLEPAVQQAASVVAGRERLERRLGGLDGDEAVAWRRREATVTALGRAARDGATQRQAGRLERVAARLPAALAAQSAAAARLGAADCDAAGTQGPVLTAALADARTALPVPSTPAALLAVGCARARAVEPRAPGTRPGPLTALGLGTLGDTLAAGGAPDAQRAAVRRSLAAALAGGDGAPGRAARRAAGVPC